jgi:hypothetical protein
MVHLGIGSRMAVDWTQLPEELVQSISKKITVYVDYVRFRAVCSIWCQSIPKVPCHLPPQLPWLMLPLSKSQPRYQRSFYDLSTGNTYHIELPEASRPEIRICSSSNGWLVILDDSPAIVLLNPLTHAKFHLPSLISFPNVVSFDYSRVGQEYGFFNRDGELYYNSLRAMRDIFIRKIVISSDPLNDNFVAMAILRYNDELAYYKNGDLSWTFFPDVGYIEDIVYYKEQFYALKEGGVIAVCNVNCELPSVSVNFRPPRPPIYCLVNRLVNSGDDELLMVARHCNTEVEMGHGFGTLRFDVFRMNWSGPSWDRVENLGDRLLFIGGNSSVSLSGSDFQGCLRNPCYLSPCGDYGQCLKNCIYFTDDIYCFNCNPDAFAYGVFGKKGDRGIFKLWDETFVSLPYRELERGSWELWFTPSPGGGRESEDDVGYEVDYGS